MKSLLEAIFSLLIFGIIIMNLPTIIGFISLCIIIKIAYSIINGSSSDNEETQTNKQNGNTEMHNLKTKYKQKMEEQKTEKITTNHSDTYSSYHYSRPHYSNDDGYDNSYYDHWQDDIPPEEGDGWQGTGNPFV